VGSRSECRIPGSRGRRGSAVISVCPVARVSHLRG
jgi:hypothetical protein